ncbi:MAG: STAS domain-containing protein [Leptolyngbyaceae cyanobacterium bins.349]|nr:STAS domain-containing protein [Leptolyngbyaceae cyanobacterium bins.349]
MRSLLARPQTSAHAAIVIQPIGALNAGTVMQFHHELNGALANGHHPNLLIDMRQVEHIDSAGVMALVSAVKLTKKFNKQFLLCSVSRPVRMILELTQLDSILEIIEAP